MKLRWSRKAGKDEEAGITWARKFRERFFEKVICGFPSQWWNCIVNSPGPEFLNTDNPILKQITVYLA